MADEPTTALDVTVQAGILRLLDQLRRDRGVSVMIITHDLGVLSTVSDRICVLYGGRVAEYGPTASVLGQPRHPYTEGLMRSLPGASRPGAMVPIRERPRPGRHARVVALFILAAIGRRESAAPWSPPCGPARGRAGWLACDIDPFAAPGPTDSPSASNPSASNPST